MLFSPILLTDFVDELNSMPRKNFHFCEKTQYFVPGKLGILLFCLLGSPRKQFWQVSAMHISLAVGVVE